MPLAITVCALSGLALSLANPPAALWPVALVAIAPLIALVGPSRPRRGLLLGLVFGAAYFGATLYWIALFGEMAWGALSFASAGYLGVFGLLAPLVWRPGRGVRSAVALAALWTGLEYLRGMWPLGGFTWGGVGYTQVDNDVLLPLASISGVWGISFVVVLVNGLVVAAVTEARRGRILAVGWVAVASIAVVVAPAVIPVPRPAGQVVDVAIVQGNDLEVDLDPTVEDLRVAQNHAALHRSLAQDPPDLAIWPENSLDVDPTLYPLFGELVEGSVREVGAPTLVGAITGRPGGVQSNEGLLYDGTGQVVDRYAKVHLVPFGEFVPWRWAIGWISAIDQIGRDLTPGEQLKTLAVGELRFADLICFENTFASLDRRLVAQGAEFLVVSTNNASYRRTAASRQHLIMSRMRAVENGRWVVHAAVSGISAFIDPNGTVHDRTGLFELTVARGQIQASTARTLYNRTGDVVPWACFAIAVAVALPPRRRTTRRRATAPVPPRPRTLVILPTYNERPTLQEVVQRVRAAADVDVLVVDDGSPDGTGELVREIAERDPRVRLLPRERKAGLAGAYRAGFRRALQEGYDLVVEMDADLSHQPEELPTLLDGARRHDVTVGSRYVPGGSVTNWGLVRRLLSRGGNRYARFVLGVPVSDSTSGFRVFRPEVLGYLLDRGIRSEGYGFQIETVYRAWQAGFDVGEVPITFREREHGHSKISRRIVVEALALVALWGIRDRMRPQGHDDEAERDGVTDPTTAGRGLTSDGTDPNAAIPSPQPDVAVEREPPIAPSRR